MTDPVADALLPPAILAVLTLLLLLARRRRAAAAALAALVLLSVEAVPHGLLAPLLLPAAAPPVITPAAIVVLASGLPELLDPSRTVPDLETFARLRAAAALSRRTGAPILVSGAQASDGPVPVAARMAQSLAADFEVPAAWAETGSTNLWQSAAATAAILRAAGISGVYLVVQPWEFRLSAAVFGAAGLDVTLAPVSQTGQRPLDRSALVAFTPAWLDSAMALRQWAGLACQAFRPCAAWMARPTPDPS